MNIEMLISIFIIFNSIAIIPNIIIFNKQIKKLNLDSNIQDIINNKTTNSIKDFIIYNKELSNRINNYVNHSYNTYITHIPIFIYLHILNTEEISEFLTNIFSINNNISLAIDQYIITTDYITSKKTRVDYFLLPKNRNKEFVEFLTSIEDKYKKSLITDIEFYKQLK